MDQLWYKGRNNIEYMCSNCILVRLHIRINTRYSTKFGQPEDSVDQQKMNRIFQAANQYMYALNYQGEFCFDIISIVIKPEKKIRFIEDAFFPIW